VKTICSPAQNGQESERLCLETWLVNPSPTRHPVYGREVANPKPPDNPSTDPLKLPNPDWICNENPSCANCWCCEFDAPPMLIWELPVFDALIDCMFDPVAGSNNMAEIKLKPLDPLLADVPRIESPNASLIGATLDNPNSPHDCSLWATETDPPYVTNNVATAMKTREQCVLKTFILFFLGW
jgi:hypothetical protein